MFERDPDIEEEQVSFITTTKKGSRVKRNVRLRYTEGRINLIGLPFGLKDEIKACLSNPRWNHEAKYWSVADDLRTRFQMEILQGGDPYANWDQPLIEHEYERPLMTHQRLMTDWCLTYKFCILAAEMGVGKSLSLIEGMEKSDIHDWWYVSTKSGLKAVEMEFDKWKLSKSPELMTYEGVLKRAKNWNPGNPVPQGIIYDEFSRCKNDRAQRAQACRHFADQARIVYGWDARLWGASGSPAPKSPVDWWMLCEIIFPGFLRENSAKSFEWRLGIFEEKELPQGTFPVRVAWRDDERRCDICGKFEYEQEFDDYGVWTGDFTNVKTHVDEFGIPQLGHDWTPSVNEVKLLSDRTKGLVLPLRKKDCLDLPDLEYIEEVVEPTATVKRAARALASAATNTMQALTWLRALSDGFQYNMKETGELVKCGVCKGSGIYKSWEVDEEDDEIEAWTDYQKKEDTCEACGGTGEIPEIVKEAKYFKGPKQDLLEKYLDKCEEHGRMIVSAGFTASIDRCVKICHNKGWHVVRIDGRGWKVMRHDGEKVPRGTKPIQFFNEHPDKVAIVMHPESGGTGLTLTAAYLIFVFSNDFKPENRIQMINRIHRPGMTRGGVIVDVTHLGTDRKVADTLKDNHRLEQMSIGDVRKALE